MLVGNVLLANGNGSNFEGFVYVDGNFTMRAPSDIFGSVMCTGNLSLQGSGDYATVTFDQGVLDTLRNNYGSYNISSPFDRPWKDQR